MDDLEEKIGSILNNPQMMQQLMSVAQSLGGQGGSRKDASCTDPEHLPEIDPGMLQKLSGLAGQSTIDSHQRALLNALCPYLSRERLGKLEKAMRAAKLAKLASGFLGSGGLQLLTGR